MAALAQRPGALGRVLAWRPAAVRRQSSRDADRTAGSSTLNRTGKTVGVIAPETHSLYSIEVMPAEAAKA
jgi:hypothetical protein